MRADEELRRLSLKLDCGDLPPDELLFVLRARDELSARAVRAWCVMAAQGGVPQDKVEEASRLADAMDCWPEKTVAGTTEERLRLPRLKITIPGTPIGKPRMTQRDKWKNRPCVERWFAWKDQAASQLREAGGHPANVVKSLSWVANFVPPKSWSKKKREAALGQPHRSKPDRDNIDKAVLDSLFPESAGGDSGIPSGHLRKVWAPEASLEVEIVYEPE